MAADKALPNWDTNIFQMFTGWGIGSLKVHEEKDIKMAIGARDFIDKLLVEKYAKEQVDNHDQTESRIKPEEVFEVMNYASCNAINHFKLSQRLAIACYAVNAKAAHYRSIRPVGQGG